MKTWARNLTVSFSGRVHRLKAAEGLCYGYLDCGNARLAESPLARITNDASSHAFRVAYIAYHSHHGSWVAAQPNLFPDRILARPQAARHLFADDQRQRGARGILLGKETAVQQRNLQRQMILPPADVTEFPG
jgi:hypothetical protein